MSHEPVAWRGESFTSFQIISWLEPLDLLHLTRASKALRAKLMSKDNSRLWKAARKNVPGLPACPSVLSEPRYAAFVFDQYCCVRELFERFPSTSQMSLMSRPQACGIERSTNLVYTFHLRFCAPCFKTKYVALRKPCMRLHAN